MSIRTLSIRQDGARVQLFEVGRLLCELPWDAALDLSQAIQAKAKQAEEYAKAPAIIHDQAIVTRLGLRFGLTSNPLLLKEATREAAWNRELRRYIPVHRAMGIASQSVVGTPSLIHRRNGGTL